MKKIIKINLKVKHISIFFHEGPIRTKAGKKSRYTVLSHVKFLSCKNSSESHLVPNCDTQAAHHSWHGGENHSASVHRHLNIHNYCKIYTVHVPGFGPLPGLQSSNADPDPSDPYVFGHPDHSIMISSSKNSMKSLDSYCYVTSF